MRFIEDVSVLCVKITHKHEPFSQYIRRPTGFAFAYPLCPQYFQTNKVYEATAYEMTPEHQTLQNICLEGEI